MKRMTYLVMALAMVLGLAQCKKEQLVEPQGEQVRITLNVNNGNGSKAEVNPPHVNFVNGDQILVASDNHYVGTLTHNGTNFSGDVTNPTEGEPLYFYFLGNKQGAIEVGADECTVNISDQTYQTENLTLPVISMGVSIDRANHNAIVTYSSEVDSYEAQLHNKASLMKFNVTTPSDSPICITGMNNKVTVDFSKPTNDGENNGFSYGMDPDDGGLIKMPAKDENNVTWAIVLPQPALAAGSFGSAYTEDTDESNCYLGLRPAISPIGSNEYIIVNENDEPITMTVNIPKYVNLDGKYWYNGGNGQVLYNTESGSMPGYLYISPNATVTLRNVNIQGGIDACDQEGDTCTIVLEGENYVINSEFYNNYAAVHTQNGTTMVIKGTGTLHATGGEYGAGIGAAYDATCGGYGECGNIRIEGGTIYATGGADCAGIGGMYWDSRPCGDITITGGEVHATGGKNAPGIGSGNGGECGNILISGGTVVAEGTKTGSAGIGTGLSGTCGNITITSSVTKVTAIRRAGKPIGQGSTAGSPVCGTVMFGDETMFDGSAWITTPTNGSTYGGLNLTITRTYLNNDTWILQP